MTEQPPAVQPEESPDASTTSDPTGEPTSTGVPAVDEMLREVDDLAGVPLEEHLGRFERAHETLRSALDAEPTEPVDPA
jgi:hypothetical protein